MGVTVFADVSCGQSLLSEFVAKGRNSRGSMQQIPQEFRLTVWTCRAYSEFAGATTTSGPEGTKPN